MDNSFNVMDFIIKIIIGMYVIMEMLYIFDNIFGKESIFEIEFCIICFFIEDFGKVLVLNLDNL